MTEDNAAHVAFREYEKAYYRKYGNHNPLQIGFRSRTAAEWYAAIERLKSNK